MRRTVLLLALVGCGCPNTTDRIVDAARRENHAYAKLEELCDDVGNRLSGSEGHDRAVAWALETLKHDGHENVRAEKVMVRRWVRGRESLAMLEPRPQPIAMLGLGGSVGTSPEGVTGEVVVVRDEKDLDDRAAGKIVLFDNPFTKYGESVRFRVNGARLAAEKGAIACLVRSVASASLRSPHTGMMRYGDAPRKIPAAAVSTEDAAMLARLVARGRRVVVKLEMEARDEGLVPSANVVAELRGRTHPDEIVVIGGHLDSWDVGQGAHDDGAGCVIAMEALSLLRRTSLAPRRTIRVVLWTNEENGGAGARQYAADHAGERHVAAIEADSGGFAPIGFSIECRDPKRQEAAVRQMQQFVPLLSALGPMRAQAGGAGADVAALKKSGIALLGLEVDMSRYFDVHHSQADTLDKVNRDELSRCVATMAAAAYFLAERDKPLGD